MQVSAQLARLHAVHSGGTGVALHRLQGSEQVASVEHRLDQVRLSGTGWFLNSRRVCAADRHSSQLPSAPVQVNFRYLNRLFWRCFPHREPGFPFLSFCSTLQRKAAPTMVSADFSGGFVVASRQRQLDRTAGDLPG
jgi:hypothetical protein